MYFYLNFHLKFHSNTTSIFTSVFIPKLMMLSFYSTPQTAAEHLFTFHSLFITNSTCYNSICSKKIWKGQFSRNILSLRICTIVGVFLSYIIIEVASLLSHSPKFILDSRVVTVDARKYPGGHFRVRYQTKNKILLLVVH